MIVHVSCCPPLIVPNPTSGWLAPGLQSPEYEGVKPGVLSSTVKEPGLIVTDWLAPPGRITG